MAGVILGKLVSKEKGVTELKEAVTMFGRGKECLLSFKDNHVSKKHCKIELKENTFFLIDLRFLSSNFI